jgi:hypothetical protein
MHRPQVFEGPPELEACKLEVQTKPLGVAETVPEREKNPQDPPPKHVAFVGTSGHGGVCSSA